MHWIAPTDQPPCADSAMDLAADQLLPQNLACGLAPCYLSSPWGHRVEQSTPVLTYGNSFASVQWDHTHTTVCPLKFSHKDFNIDLVCMGSSPLFAQS